MSVNQINKNLLTVTCFTFVVMLFRAYCTEGAAED